MHTALLRILGVCIMIMSFALSGLNMKRFLTNTAAHSTGSVFLTMIASNIYLFNGIAGCTLICMDFYVYRKRFFIGHHILALISIAFALVEGAFELYSSFLYSFVYFGYCFVNFSYLYITCVAQQDIKDQYETRLEQMNANGVQIISTGRDGIPKFSMPVQVTRVDMPVQYELEPMNKATGY